MTVSGTNARTGPPAWMGWAPTPASAQRPGRVSRSEQVRGCGSAPPSILARLPVPAPPSPLLSPAGWDCSEDVDECEAQGPPRCRNGGTCQNSAGGFHCVCVSGWGGPGCDENLDDCALATCALGSTCIDRVGSFSCVCPPGRTGAGRGCGGGDTEGEKVPEGQHGVPSSLQEPCPWVSHRPPVPPGRQVFEPAMPWQCPVQHQPSDGLFPLLMPAWLLGTHLPPGPG